MLRPMFTALPLGARIALLSVAVGTATGATGLGVLAGLGAAALWAGGSHLFDRQIEREAELTAPAANLFKNALTVVVFGVVWLLGAGGQPGTEAWAYLWISGALGFAVGDALYFSAFSRCGVQLAAICGLLIPPLAALGDFFFEGVMLPWPTWVAMGVTMVGIVLVLRDPSATRPGEEQVDPKLRRQGFLLALAAAGAQALSIVTGNQGFEVAGLGNENLIPVTVIRLIGGVSAAFLIAVLLEGRPGLNRISRPLRRPDLGSRLVVPALVAAVINLPLYSYALGHLSPGVSSILFATTPLFALPIGLLRGARFGVFTYTGTFLAFAGVAGVIQTSGT